VQHQPKSMLCTPILQQGKLVAILYLENNVTVGAFTSDRVQLLNFLCTQAAISLENARLYEQEQQKSREMAQKEAEYRSIFESVNDGLSISDLETGETVAVNPVLCQMYGYSQEEWLELTPVDFMHPDSLHLFSSFLETLNLGKEFYAQGLSRRKDGSYFDFEVKAVPFIYQEKLRGLTIVRDISDRKAAENLIQEKNKALEQTLTQLQQSQAQVVQSEKMSALGNLVAGVAHEVNNPIGFLNGSINNAKDYVQDLLDYIALYQQHHPDAALPVQEKAEEIDLEFLGEDLPKLLDSMQGATNRIKSISTSLRTFSRADTEQKVSANLHEGIDSTLLILKYRLKANENRSAIEVIQDYGDLPTIQCFPGQLNQVFMNILANAIDVLDESNIGRSFAEIQANPNKITIKTSIEDNQVKISIADNGKGMSEEVKQKIFDHLFTTKGVGKGTGLGLAIARQIVVKKHGGSLEVKSELGRGSEFCIRLAIAG
jgi:PAS domain S-box-containing protein